jgi:putative alpha-1,2-mannosidase
MTHLFNFSSPPWLVQKWVCMVKKQTYGGITPMSGYNGDEDQGDLGAVSALMAIGLFDVKGGAEVNPNYQITSPVFGRVTIHLNPHYFSGREFSIITHNNSPKNIYIQSARLNGQPLNRFWFSYSDAVKGGWHEIELCPKPNRWAADSTLPLDGNPNENDGEHLLRPNKRPQ